ncbi:HD-GYP domain-containing protein [Candidatus Caldatribacterium sp.]|uniref:HD-GYP domain-containing protein n=1 Tax=Candidatus Caldatribacterium sp. TaxID=2282143 RepID=UPI00384491A8|nr:HD-GYP domain-containing protein [Candidatus Caldatribacterium sp.]
MRSLRFEAPQPFQEFTRWAIRRGALLVLWAFSLFLGASLAFVLYLSGTVTSIVTASVVENAGEIRENVRRIFSKYTPVLQELLLSLRNNPENIDGKVQAACVFPELEEIHYFWITPQGLIFATNYPKDLGLDLSAFPKFWEALKKELAQKPVVVHPFALETRTGRIRMYLYTRTENGNILELGVTLRQSVLDPLFEDIKRLEHLPFVKRVGLYTAHFLPVASAFPPLPEGLKRRMAALPQRQRFGLARQTVIQRIRVPLLSNVAMTMLTVTEFDFLALYVFSGVLLLAGLLFLLHFRRQHNTCLARIANDLATLSTIAKNDLPSPKREFAFLETQRIAEALYTSRREIEEAFTVFAHKLALIAEGYDTKTSLHMQRVAKITELLARELGIVNPDIPRYAGLHDIGKIFIPREILKKEGPLSEKEWELMKLHTLLTEQLFDHPRLVTARNMALYHHENFDGTGYPKGLKGEAIPIEAQILKIADIYDALRDDRPYRRAFSHEEAMRIILEGDERVRREHFHPKVLAAFLKLENAIRALYDEV